MVENMNKIQGFITNLGKYTEGHLIGEWIEFPISDEELSKVYQRIEVDGEHYQEIFFTDWECTFDFHFGEFERIDEVNKIAEALEELNEYDYYKTIAILEAGIENDLMEAIDHLDDYIFYQNQTCLDLAYEYVENDVPSDLLRYFDYESFARDLKMDDYFETSYGVVLSC